MVQGMGDRIVAAVADKGSAVCVGLDPRWPLLPAEVVEKARATAGDDIRGRAEALRLFGREVIDLVAPHAAAIKPQVAFYEPFHGPGFAAFVDLCRYARSRGLFVIGDVKRGDIGSTAEAYARSYFDPEDGGGPVTDCCTVSAWFGSDGVRPFLEAAAPEGGGIFVLVRTSNPSAGEIQDLMVQGVPLHLKMAAKVREWNRDHLGDRGYGPVGSVVGATRPDLLKILRDELPTSILLVPGYGAQGATARDVAPAFHEGGRGALISASRSITFPWAATGSCPTDWRGAIEEAVIAMKREIAGALGLD